MGTNRTNIIKINIRYIEWTYCTFRIGWELNNNNNISLYRFKAALAKIGYLYYIVVYILYLIFARNFDYKYDVGDL